MDPFRTTSAQQAEHNEIQAKLVAVLKGVVKASRKLYGFENIRKAVNTVARELNQDKANLPYRDKWLED